TTEDADVVVASRYVPGGRDSRDARGRVLASRAINLLGSACLGGAGRDWTSGFVAARPAAVGGGPLRTPHLRRGYFSDLLYRACRTGLRVVEVPYRLPDRRAGETKTSGSVARFGLLGLRYVETILTLRWHALSGRKEA